MKLAPILVIALAAGLLCPSGAGAQQPGKQTAAVLNRQITRTVRLDYLAYLPADYGMDKEKKWPLMLFLHGSGESGSDVEKVKVHGPPKLIAVGQEMPFIVISPQCPNAREGWDPGALMALLDEVSEKYSVDPDRVYLTGLSMGGYGTWALATAHPERFAAIAPICGGGRPRAAGRLNALPIWVFHGAKDSTVPLSQSQEMVDALRTVGADVRFTIYPEAGHDSWTETYNNPELYSWLLSHKRGEK